MLGEACYGEKGIVMKLKDMHKLDTKSRMCKMVYVTRGNEEIVAWK